jgi:mannose-6-phosphate isomerase-like protein (cupin superfamily)
MVFIFPQFNYNNYVYTKIITSTESLIKPPISNTLRAGCVELKTNEEVGEHITDNKEEILVILRGKAHVVCENEITDINEGIMVFIPKNKKHNVINKSREILKYIYIVSPLNKC